MYEAPTIVPREKLQFGLDQEIPKYWFAGDAFKSRYCDAMSVSFPEGERFFISCVRDFRDQVTDPVMLQEIKDFIRQEGQHGIIHNQFNDHLKRQGIDVDMFEEVGRAFLFNFMRKYLPKSYNLAYTAACEHLTAIMAETFFEHKRTLEGADPRMYAMYAWHAMEEMEHKAVAYDVMQKVAKVGYLTRVLALIHVTWTFNLHLLWSSWVMLRTDGFSLWQRTKMLGKGLWWLFGRKGLYSSSFRSYMSYYKPGFHPWQNKEMSSYGLWLDVFNRTGNPIEAGRAVFAAAI